MATHYVRMTSSLKVYVYTQWVIQEEHKSASHDQCFMA